MIDKLINEALGVLVLENMNIEPETFKESVYVAGGAANAFAEKGTPKDIDLFFRDARDAQLIARAWSGHPSKSVTVADADNGTQRVVLSGVPTLRLRDTIVTTRNAITVKTSGASVQFILRYCGPPEAVVSTFDFLHCKMILEYNAATAGLWRFSSLDPLASLSLSRKELLVQNSYRTPLASMFRLKKFLERGWTVEPLQLVKLAIKLSEVNWRSPNQDLEDQLEGVYGSPVVELIPKIRVLLANKALVSAEDIFALIDKDHNSCTSLYST